MHFKLIKNIGLRSLVEDPEQLELEVDFYMPKVISNGKFKGEGRIGQMPLMGKGVFNVTSCKHKITHEQIIEI